MDDYSWILIILFFVGGFFLFAYILDVKEKRDKVKTGQTSFERSEEKRLLNGETIHVLGYSYLKGANFDKEKVIRPNNSDDFSALFLSQLQKYGSPVQSKVLEYLALKNDANYYFVFQESYYWVYVSSEIQKIPMYFGDNTSTITSTTRAKRKAIDIYRVSKLDQTREAYASYILGAFSIVENGAEEVKDVIYQNNTQLASHHESSTFSQPNFQIPPTNSNMIDSKMTISGKVFLSIEYIGNEEVLIFPKNRDRICLLNGIELRSIKTVVIPNHVTKIDAGAFCKCPNLEKIIILEGNRHFDCRNNSNAIIETTTNKLIAGCADTIIPPTVTEIESYAFAGRIGMTKMEIPNSVSIIGSCAFVDCPKMNHIIIPKSVSVMGSAVFSSYSLIMSGLKRFYWHKLADSKVLSLFIEHDSKPVMWDEDWIGEGIEKRAVYWIGMWHLDINKNPVVGPGETQPNSLEFISSDFEINEPGVFVKYLGTASDVIIPDTIKEIKSNAFFQNQTVKSIFIPASVVRIHSGAFSFCRNLEKITVSTENTIYDSRKDSNTVIESKANTLIAGCKNSVIPNSVKCIGHGAFAGVEKMKGIIIPDSVEEIKYGAFSDCLGLKYVVIPQSVMNVEANIFEFKSDIIADLGVISPWGGLKASQISSLKIFTYHSEIPASWKKGWNINEKPVFFKNQWTLINDATSNLLVPVESK